MNQDQPVEWSINASRQWPFDSWADLLKMSLAQHPTQIWIRDDSRQGCAAKDVELSPSPKLGTHFICRPEPSWIKDFVFFFSLLGTAPPNGVDHQNENSKNIKKWTNDYCIIPKPEAMIWVPLSLQFAQKYPPQKTPIKKCDFIGSFRVTGIFLLPLSLVKILIGGSQTWLSNFCSCGIQGL